MRILTDSDLARAALESFKSHLKKDCVPLTAQVRVGTGWRRLEVAWNPGLGLWTAWRSTKARETLFLGLGDPAYPARLTPCAEIGFRAGGIDPREAGFFVRFGGDALVACRLRERGNGESLAAFLERHGHGPTVHELEEPGSAPGASGQQQDSPGAGSFKAFILCSAASPDAGFHLRRLAGALHDHERWNALGLGDAGSRIAFGPRALASACVEGAQAQPLREAVARSLREQLQKFVDARKLRCKLGSAPGCDIVLASGEGAVQAVFQVRDSLAPAALESAIGELILSRHTLRAAKCLAVPGPLGPYFTQVLFRHDIHVVPYTLTPELAAVLDVEAVFQAIRHTGF
ncbi:hypothetical protein NNJEOMEG_02374 [Fundidesulfovibrio magnetotacticus]|uniref:Uncharacterized protein n=1 Tax=Fundidesulfovibrio magnetotacticus TaxID=2730080 RepID=A0A6V8LW37_9BACT|nr:hypothetical protein [Fundidesulfovibrio magnetotacticus]GFK94528.1 hypothetical protein NNJEOMEG_02374 [Fundidesulfovibrio magnetotacticus]